jgi:hypothetical protein
MYCIYKLCKFFGCCCKEKKTKALNKEEGIPLNTIIQQQDSNKKINEILNIAKNKFPIVTWKIKGEKITIFFSNDDFVYFTNIIEQKNDLSDKLILVENCLGYNNIPPSIFKAHVTIPQLFNARQALSDAIGVNIQPDKQNKEQKLFL